jgi:DNA-binding transcriptional ArsR family regulator
MSILNLPFKSLKDPARRNIILLLKDKNMTSGETVEHFNNTKPNISQHS